MAVAKPDDQRVGREVAQGVAGEFLEAADEGFAMAVLVGIGVGAVLGTA